MLGYLCYKNNEDNKSKKSKKNNDPNFIAEGHNTYIMNAGKWWLFEQSGRSIKSVDHKLYIITTNTRHTSTRLINYLKFLF